MHWDHGILKIPEFNSGAMLSPLKGVGSFCNSKLHCDSKNNGDILTSKTLKQKSSETQNWFSGRNFLSQWWAANSSDQTCCYFPNRWTSHPLFGHLLHGDRGKMHVDEHASLRESDTESTICQRQSHHTVAHHRLRRPSWQWWSRSCCWRIRDSVQVRMQWHDQAVAGPRRTGMDFHRWEIHRKWHSAGAHPLPSDETQCPLFRSCCR